MQQTVAGRLVAGSEQGRNDPSRMTCAIRIRGQIASIVLRSWRRVSSKCGSRENGDFVAQHRFARTDDNP
jgi:hypothetical protein